MAAGSLRSRSTQVVWAQTKTAPGASGNVRMFGRKPQTALKWVENTGANGRAQITCGHQRLLRTRTRGRGQHVGANIQCVCGREGVDGRARRAGRMPDRCLC
jgi:hypothetical protein